MSNVVNITTLGTSAQIVDQIGLIKAQIAPQLKQLKMLEEALKAHGPGVYEGTAYDATITESERSSLDMDAVRAKLSPQFITAHTRTTIVKTLKVVAKVLDRRVAQSA